MSGRRRARARSEGGAPGARLGLGLVKLLVGAAMPALAAGYGLAAWELASAAVDAPGHLAAFAAGAAGCVPVWLAARRLLGLSEPLEFFMTLEHELTHLVAGLVFLKRPHSLQASASGHGEVVLYGDNFVILLAPYFLPTISLALAPAPLLLRDGLLGWYFVVLGATAGYHVLSTMHELSPRQTDIKRSGYVFSALFLPVANLVCYGALAAFAAGGYAGAAGFLRAGVEAAWVLALRLAA